MSDMFDFDKEKPGLNLYISRVNLHHSIVNKAKDTFSLQNLD